MSGTAPVIEPLNLPSRPPDQQFASDLKLIAVRLGVTCLRAIDLARVTARLPPTDPTGGEIGRAAIVLVHAAFEDFLRGLGRLLLPSSGPHGLAGIPILYENGKPEFKATLSDLTRFRGTTVSDLISKAVQEHLSRRSFSSVDDVVQFLDALSLRAADVRPFFPHIHQLVMRRHAIVHEADLPHPSAMRPRNWSVEDDRVLNSGAAAVMRFAGSVIFGAAERCPPGPAMACLRPELTALFSGVLKLDPSFGVPATLPSSGTDQQPV